MSTFLHRRAAFTVVVVFTVLIAVFGSAAGFRIFASDGAPAHQFCIDQAGNVRLLGEEVNGRFNTECKPAETLIELPDNSRVQALELMALSMSQSLGALEDRLLALELLAATIPELQTSMDALGQSLDAQAARLAALEALAQAIPGLQDAIDGLGTSLDGLQGRLEAVEAAAAGIPNLEQAVGSLGQSLQDLADRVAAVELVVSTVPGELVALSGDLQAQAGLLSGFTGQIQDLQTLLTAIEVDLAELSTRLQAIEAGAPTATPTPIPPAPAQATPTPTPTPVGGNPVRAAFINDLATIVGGVSNINLLWLPSPMDTTSSISEDSLAQVITYDGDVSGRTSRLGPGVAVSFDGANNLGTVPDNDVFSFGDGTGDQAFSIVALANINNTSVKRTVLAKYDTSAGTSRREWRMYLEPNDTLAFGIYDPSAGGLLVKSTKFATLMGVPAIYVGTYSGSGSSSGMDLYVNGSTPVVWNLDVGTYSTTANTQSTVQVGHTLNAGQQPTDFMDGSMGLVMLVNKELLPGEITALNVLIQSYFGLTP